MMRKITAIALFWILLIGTSTLVAQDPAYHGIIYVTQTGAGTHSGDSWANATSSIEEAQTIAQANNAVVWVAAGVYYGNVTGTNAFTMKDSVSVYGGFAGNEPADYDLSLRDFEVNATILDGQHERRVLYQEQAFNNRTVLDGFTIQNGNVTGNGGGAYLRHNTLLSNCRFVQNVSQNNYGGGLYYYGSSNNDTIRSCSFERDTGHYGGGVSLYYASLVNCLIANNTSKYGGGGVYSYQSAIANSTIVRNSSGSNGGGIYASDSITMVNSVVWGNQRNGVADNVANGSYITCSYSAVEGGIAGNHNIPLFASNDQSPFSPHFVNPSHTAGSSDNTGNEDWHLQQGSVCINRGDNTSVTESFDLGGTARVKRGTVDMGCFESDYNSVSLPEYDGIVYVTMTGAGTRLGNSWANAMSSIADAQAIAQTHNAMVWVATGTYYGDTASTNAFVMKDGASIYGGFVGDEPADYDLSLRDFETNATILHGQNARRVLYQERAFNNRTVLDGFTIRNGNVAGYGGGAYLRHNTLVSNCRFVQNVSQNNDGGGLYYYGSSNNDTIRSCSFERNTGHYGGGVSLYYASLVNCLIANNTSMYGGGGVYSYQSTIANSTIVRNSSGSNGGGICASDSITMVNSVVWGNQRNGVADNVANESYITCSYSAMEGGIVGNHNVLLFASNDQSPFSPHFVNPSLTAGSSDNTENVDWHIQQGSVCINRGDNTSVTESVDLDGTMRIKQDTVDIGCYESDYYSVPVLEYGGVVYMTVSGAGTQSGNSWENATSSMAVAQAIAQTLHAVIWMAAGTYYGDTTATNAFTMKDGASMYGGFVGNEPADYDLSLRDFAANPTVLDGQNTRRVLYQEQEFNNRTVLDGLTIQNGYVFGNGGGAYLRHNTLLSNCRFVHNEAYNNYGGGLYFYGESNDTIRSCSFESNKSSYGGGLYIDNVNLFNSLVYNNSSTYRGGGIYGSYDKSCITNSTIVRNTSVSDGGGVYASDSITMINSVVWGNRQNGTVSNIANKNYITFRCSAVEGGMPDSEVINLSSNNYGSVNQKYCPCFVSPENGDFRLHYSSSLVNAGTALAGLPDNDLAYLARVFGDTIDIGCYEFHGESYCVSPASLTAQDVTAHAAMLTWHYPVSDGYSHFELSYKMEEDTEWTLVDSIQTEYYMLTDLQPQTAYMARVRTICDASSASPYTETKHFTTSCSSGYTSITIGETTNSSYGDVLPTSTYYSGYSYTQQIYQAAEIGDARYIDTLSVQYFYSTAQTRDVNIYLGHTSKNEFSNSNDWVPLSALTLVYSGNVTFDNIGENYWVKIPLATPFEYNGSDNIVLVFDDNTGSYTYDYGNKFYTHSTSGYASMYVYSDYTNSNLISPASGNRTSYRNNLRLSGACEDDSCYRSIVSAVEVTDHSAKLVCVAGTGMGSYELEFKESSEEDFTPLTTTDDTYQLTGLRQNTPYVARIRSLCGSQNSHWKYTYFTTGVGNYDRLYVTASGNGEGDSWANACGDLDWALNTAEQIKNTYGIYPDIWVAAGTYYGDTTATNAFTLMDGVNMYGGFAGNEPADYDLSLRDFAANPTVLDGQGSRRVVYQDNSFNTRTALDGFTIQNGYVNENGGGAYLRHNTVLSNCRFIHNVAQNNYDNYGGGLYYYGSSYDTIRDCLFENNSGQSGGGLYARYCVLEECSFSYNTSAGNGGGLYLNNSNLINCLVSNNTSSYTGGGVYCYNNATIANSTIVRNQSNNINGGGVYANDSTTIVNSVVWGNKGNGETDNLGNTNYISCRYSAVEGGMTGNHNIPLFASNDQSAFSPHFAYPSLTAGASDNTENVDWHFQQGSVCINRGDNTAVRGSLDLDGTARVKQDTVDMGCFESDYHSVSVPEYGTIVYVTESGAGTQLGNSWANATSSIAEALAIAQTHQAVVWVAAGTYFGDTTATNAFFMKDGASLYGSFVGNEPADFDLSLRDFSANPTVLDGQGARRVVNQTSSFNNPTALDGFTIQNGYANGNGGGAYLRHNTRLSNCRFVHNVAQNNYGGGLYYYGEYTNYGTSHDTIKNCAFEGNTSGSGGGLYLYYTTAINCLVHNNSSTSYGGGVYSSTGSKIANSTIVRNASGSKGGGIYGNSSTTLVNSVVWGNRKNGEVSNIDNGNYISCSYSAVEGGMSGSNMINLSSDNFGTVSNRYYPCFLSPENEDYRLYHRSSLINAGGTLSGLPSTDLAHEARVFDDTVDIGCYEFHGESYCASPISLTASDVTGNAAMLTWQNPFLDPFSYYELSYKKSEDTEWIVIDSIQTDYYMFTNLQPQTAYMARVRAICEIDTISDYTNIIHFKTNCSAWQDSVLIGQTSTNSCGGVIPTYMYYGYSYSQQIYQASEIGGGRNIDTLSLQYFYSSTQTRNVNIYLGHTLKTEFASSSDWVPLTALTLVYSGNVTFENTGEEYWFKIPLSTTFEYNGIDNLVLAFDDNTGLYTYNSSDRFYTHQTSGYSSMYVYSGSMNYDPANPASGNRLSCRTNLRIPTACLEDSCSRSNVSAVEVTDHSAKLVCVAGVGADSYELEFKEYSEEAFIPLTTIDDTYQLTGLKQNTPYVARIRSLCGNQFSQWKYAFFTTGVTNYARLYVTPSGNGNGDTWATACGDINWALNTAALIQSTYGTSPEIWVATGIYYGGTDATAQNAFTMVEGVNVYGGFAGNEPSDYNLSLRNFAANPTILDGQGSRRVVYQANSFNTRTVLDGFTIQNGYVSGNGGGAYLRHNALLSNCRFVHNVAQNYNNGGGLYFDGNIQDTIRNCSFEKNTAGGNGGGLYLYRTSAVNCLVFNNSSNSNGGGVYCDYGVNIANSTIVRNESGSNGGGVYASGGTTMVNSVVWGNRQNGAYSNIANEQNISCNYSAVEGGIAGNHNIPLFESNDQSPFSPHFVNPSLSAGASDNTSNVNWHLQQGSVCVNRGDNGSLLSVSDLDGTSRIKRDTVDMGCYESDYYSASVPEYDSIIYVTVTGAGTQSGNCWANAISSIADAQAIAQTYNAKVWVAAGTYYGDTTATNAFTMKDGVSVYGGFVGNESADYDLSLRDFAANPTVLDGQGSRRVVYQANSFNKRTTLDGFTIQNGYVAGNGGGAYLRHNTRLSNCDFVSNVAQNNSGGGLYYYGDSYDTIRNCSFSHNTSGSGGGLYLYYTRAINCLVYNNSSSSNGGGVYSSYGTTIANSTIVRNASGSNGGGVYADGSTSMVNSVVWGNRKNGEVDNIVGYSLSYSNSAVEGGTTDNQNILLLSSNQGVLSPCFVNPSSTAGATATTTNVDWHLQASSPCINRGINERVVDTLDKDGNPRIQHDTVDMGCYESHHSSTTLPTYDSIIYVKVAGAGTRSGNSWANAISSIEEAQMLAMVYNAKVWVAAGTYHGYSSASNSFVLKDGVSMYGGFAGNEPADYDLSLRDFAANPTVLNGQNNRRVVYQANSFNTPTALDGFTIQNGKTTENGGGAYLRHNTLLSNCRFVQNVSQNHNGGGLYYDGSSEDTIRSCSFERNTGYSGGGVYAGYCILENCSFSHNTSKYGGGVYLYYSTTINCLVNNNSSSYYGGGVYSSYGTIANSTIVRNMSGNSNGGGVCVGNSTTVVNSVIWGNQSNGISDNLSNSSNVSCNYSAVEGGATGDHVINLSSDNSGSANHKYYPWFVSPENGDFSLHNRSSLVNVGINMANLPNTDLKQEVRVFDDTVDIGCYEFHGEVYCMSPISLAVSDITGHAAMLTWQNPAPDDIPLYELSYKKAEDAVWTVVDSIQTEYYMLTDLQPLTAYLARVRTICDASSESYYTETKHFSTSCTSGFTSVTIGETTTSSNGWAIPTYMYYPYSYTQQIYQTAEIGEAGTIDTLFMQYFYSDPQTRNVNVYLGHTQKNEFANSSDWVPLTALTLVYSGNVTFDNTGGEYWFKIPLATPFEYNGFDNLVLAFDDNTGSYTYNSSSRFYTHQTSGYSSMYVYSGSMNYDPANPTSGSRISYRNNLRFSSSCVEDSCDRSNVSAVEVTDHSAKLVCVAGVGADGYELEFKESSEEAFTSLTTFDDTYQLTGLRQNTSYVARIRSLCGNQFSRWKYTYFTTEVVNYNRLYVTPTGNGDGGSWATACSDINWALNTAERIQNTYGTYPELWVAAGIYYGDTTETNAFTLKEGVNMYGGFVGNEPADYDLSLRDFTAAPTILDGQNNRRVVYQANSFNTQTVLDGFTIQNGYTTGNGGGAYLRQNTLLSNCRFVQNVSQNNYGGGLYYDGSSYDTIRSCSFEKNTGYYGGGVYAQYSILENCSFSHNTSSYSGGGVYLYYSSIINCLVYNNTSSYQGGGVYSIYGTIANSTIVRNKSGSSNGGGVYVGNSTTVVNGVIWGNQYNGVADNLNNTSRVSCSYSAVEGGFTGNHVIPLSVSNDNNTYSPYFVHPSDVAGATDTTANVDWHLQIHSPCINRGNDSEVTLSFDIDGNDRIQQDSVDLGCYESEHSGIALPVYDSIIYVTQTGAGTMTGESWDNAIPSIEDAMSLALCHNAVVWVASGTYYGDTTASNAFRMRDGVSVYGGFAGNEPADYDLSLRDFTANPTILDGQGSRRVVYQASSFNTRTALDGFTIQNGYTTGNGSGANLSHNTLLSNCRFVHNVSQNNYGGGLYYYGNGNLYDTIRSCSFEGNTGYYGGGVYAQYCILENCSISYNTSSYSGGGVYLYYSSAINCLVFNNTSSSHGGGVYGHYGTIVNSTIVRNKSGSSNGGGVYDGYRTTITNCVIWGNQYNGNADNLGNVSYSLCSYSAVEGGFAGVHIIPLSVSNDHSIYSPYFVRPSAVAGATDTTADVDWHLQIHSPCINRGDNSEATLSFDLDGNNRIQHDVVDLGCYESEYTEIALPVYDSIIYVTQTGAGTKAGESWDNAIPSIEDAMSLATCHNAVVWVAAGTYYGDTTGTNAFRMRPGVSVYGGFSGDEPADYDLSLRDFDANASILDGHNSRRVLYQPSDFNASTAVTWDGFTIQNGRVNGYGAGVYLRGSSSLQNCLVQYNASYSETSNNSRYGGGVYAYCSSGSVIQISHCKILHNVVENTSYGYAGGLYTYNAKVSHTEIAHNSSTYRGGGVYNSSYTTFSNCLIHHNTSTNGGGVYNNSSSCNYVNCDIVSNMGSGVYNYYSATFTNCIIWGNKKNYMVNNYTGGSYSYCAVEEGVSGTGNIALAFTNDGNDASQYYVRFNDPENGDFRLHPTSSCVNIGSNTSVTDSFDFYGNPRIYKEVVDIGCSEVASDSTCSSVVNLMVSNVTTNSALLSWHPTGNETQWAVAWQELNGGQTTVTVTDTFLTLSGLTFNRNYMAKVRAICDSGMMSIFSIPVYFQTDCDPTVLDTLSNISSLMPEDSAIVYQNRVSFSWSLLPEATSYDFYLWPASSSEPTTPTQSGLTIASVSNYQLPNYQPGKEYYWKVVAWNECISKSSEVQLVRVNKRPDLHVSQITTSNPVAGQPLTVTWTVTNDGEGNTPPGQTWNDYIWLVRDADVRLYDDNDLRLATVSNLHSLNSGESYTNTAMVTLPEDVVGNFYLFVFADQVDAYAINFAPTGGFAPDPYTPSVTGDPYPYLNGSYHGTANPNLGEVNNHDNFFYKVLNILPPPSSDLVVSSVTHPINAFSGSQIPVTWTVSNQGEAAAVGSWYDAVYISEDTVLNTATDLRLGRFLHEGNVLIDSSYTKTEQLTIPIQYMGDYYFFVVTDYLNEVYEGLYEENNQGISNHPLNVTLTPPADLTVTAISLPDALDANREYQCSYTVENIGYNITYGNFWKDVLYLSQDSVFVRANARQLATRYHSGALMPDSSYNDVFSFVVPSDISGWWYLYVSTDEDNQIFEYLNENNNVVKRSPALLVSIPDLTVSNVVVPDTVDPNGTTLVRWTIRNNGPGDVVNRTFSDCFTFNGEVIYNGYMSSINLNSGGTISRSAVVKIPCHNTSTSSLTITTDCLENVLEGNEGNNSHTVALNVLAPDLAVTNVTAPDTVWSGTVLPEINSFQEAYLGMSYQIHNHGSLPVVGKVVTDRIYLSLSANHFQESDSLLSFTHTITLAPNETQTYTCPVPIPNGINGHYYFHVVCNVGDSICEVGNTSDNVGHSAITTLNLSPWADLVVTQVLVQDTTYIGATFPVSYTIRNNGTASLNQVGVYQKFYYSTSPTSYDNNNLLLTKYEILTLAQGAEVTSSANVALPTSQLQRYYYIHVVTDATDLVYEHTGENNNTAVSNSFFGKNYLLDLVAVEIDGPDVVQWGQTATYRLHVSNNSTLPSLLSQWQDAMYLSNDVVLNSTDLLQQMVNRNSVLNAGDDYWADFHVTIPFGTPPSAYLLGFADYYSQNPDVNYSNNSTVKNITVNSVPTPDLAVTEMMVLDDVVSGQPARLVYTVMNAGELDIFNLTWNDRLYLSLDNSYQSTDIELATQNRQNMTLAVGEYYTDTVTFTIPLPYNGSLYVLAVANATNQPYEVVRANNVGDVQVSVTLPLPGDLIVTDVLSQDSIVSGQVLHATWNVRNIGDYPLAGLGLRTLVYVSRDTLFDVNDRLLGSVTTPISLAVDAVMPQSLNARISGLAEGEYYLIVKTDVTNAFNEVDESNNAGYSMIPFRLSVRPLPFNTDVPDTLRNDEVSDFKLSVGDNIGQTVRIHLASEDSLAGAVNMIYTTYNDMGDNLNYSYSTIGQFTANPELYIPSTQMGYYGVNVYGSTPVGNTQNTVIRADILPFELHSIDADHGGNTGFVTVELTGSHFRPDMKVCLRNDNDTIYPDSLTYVNYYQAFAKFDLRGRTPGLYDVSAVNYCEGEAVLADGFTIENGQPLGLSYNLIFPNSPRPNRTIVMMLEFGNIGNVDLHDQVLEITSNGGAPISLTPEGLSQHRTTLQVPLSIEGEPDGLLRPGSYGTINIYCYSSGALIFAIKPVEE